MTMSDQPVLIKVSNGREIAIKPEMTIGRQAECDLQLTEGHASRRHARLSMTAGAVWLEDLTSANGTFINGARITSRVRLSSGDRLRFDIEEFDFRMPAVTAMRPEDKTVFRPSPQQASPVAAMAVGPSAVAASPQARNNAAVDATSANQLKRPGAWADPDFMENDGGNKTKFIDPAQIKDMIESSSAPTGAPAPAAIDGPHLQVAAGSRTGLNIRLTVGRSGVSEWTVGSQPDREVRFQDSGVSALHAKIVNEGERWKVIDQMSANGTYVNGKRSNVSFLSSGDRLRFGPVECVFHASRSESDARHGREVNRGRNKAIVIASAAFVITIVAIVALIKFVL
jgi:pSer/pThr/pTyr-binding forkhead associated (FHA) protein